MDRPIEYGEWRYEQEKKKRENMLADLVNYHYHRRLRCRRRHPCDSDR